MQVEAYAGEEMVLNMGPQHPSTHGVLRLELETDGEIVRNVTPHIGYLHRCFEKHAENIDYPGVIPFCDRMDYIASMNNSLGYALAVEKLMGLEVNERVKTLRVLMAELNRIASHLLSVGTYAMDIGSFTPFLHCFREREKVLDLFEWLCGARLLYNYNWVGGVSHDIPEGFEAKTREFVTQFEPVIAELDKLLSYNKIFLERTADVGIISQEQALSHNVTGPNLRGSGIAWDLRKEEPYCGYETYDFEVPVGLGEYGPPRFLLGPLLRAGSRDGAEPGTDSPGPGAAARRGRARAHSPAGAARQERGLRSHRNASRGVGLLPGERRRTHPLSGQGQVSLLYGVEPASRHRQGWNGGRHHRHHRQHRYRDG